MTAPRLRRRRATTAAGLIAGALLLFTAARADAYCRTHSCDPAKETCPFDGGCNVGGFELYWPSSCVSFDVQAAGSPRFGITADAFEGVIAAAFDAWRTADCGGGANPTFTTVSMGPVTCDAVEYNQHSGNADIFVFRDSVWPYPMSEDALGLSTVWFDPTTGRIYDVDVEINGTDPGAPISVGQPQDGADLPSIVTHEVGHFLGLSHSTVPGATMRATYAVGRDNLRVPSPDDVEGICAIYPPGRTAESTSCTPRHGFSGTCGADATGGDGGGGCHVAPGAAGAGGGGAATGLGALALGLAAVGARRVRRRRR